MFAAEGIEVAKNAGFFLENAWLFPAVPFASFILILFFGKRLPQKGAEIGIAALAIVFVCALGAAGQWVQHVNNSHSGHGGETTTEEEHSTTTEEEHSLGASIGRSAPVLRAEGEEPAGETPVGVEAETESGTEGGAEAEAAAEEHESVAPVLREWHASWWQSGGIEFNVGTLVDGLSVMMLVVVTLISLLVHVYSTDYVHGDIRYTHFFAFLSLFTASMLMLVISSNTVQFITSWELVGVCSFSLIGHWWEDKKNSDAALKAFITNRVGDIGLLVGMITIFFTAGGGKTFSILDQTAAVAAGTVSHTAMLVAALCLLAAVMSKSGQFFLHTWLPDAMAGPTPVSALIHAATMVVAGVFMVARLYPVFFEGFSIAGSSINMLALIGGITTLVGGSLAFVQNDIKRVLAYSTVSQLGYMVMALGVGAWTAATFHLFTHAFFKACLFLGSGSVSHACNHSFDMKLDMGGLRKYMPRTHATFLLGTLALAGAPFMSGFWSKDEILAGTGGFGLGESTNGTYHLMLAMGLLTGGMTAAYMTRCYWLTFMGEWRGANSPNAHHGDAHAVAAHDAHGADAHGAAGAPDAHDTHDAHGGLPHESGPRITIPLVILAALAFLTTFANIPEKFSFVPEGWRLRFEHYVEPKGAYFPAIKHGEFSAPIALLSIAAAVIAVSAALAYYRKVNSLGPEATELPNGLTTRSALARGGHKLLVNKYYLDWLYTDVIVASVKGPIARMANWFNQHVLDGVVNGTAETSKKAARFTYTYIDQGFIDGAVNGSGVGMSETGGLLRRIQSGRVQQYAALMFAAAAVLAGVFVLAI